MCILLSYNANNLINAEFEFLTSGSASSEGILGLRCCQIGSGQSAAQVESTDYVGAEGLRVLGLSPSVQQIKERS